MDREAKKQGARPQLVQSVPQNNSEDSQETFSENYVERDFLVEKLTPIVNREVNAKNPVYQMHKWWARRLASVFGMLLVTSFSNTSENRRDIWAKYVKGSSLTGKIILDPMMGGGTSIVETLRLGGKAVGIDVNPVAWFVTKKEIDPFDSEAIDNAFKSLEKTVGKEIQSFYKTKCLNGHDADIMYSLWHKEVECKKCHKSIAILQHYVISEKKEELSVVCPACGTIFKTPVKVDDGVICPKCSHSFKPRLGTANKGKITCPHCGQEDTILEAVKRKKEPLDTKLFCIEYYCEDCGRHYKKPEDDDLLRYKQAEARFGELKEKLQYPKQIIPYSSYDVRPQNHGYQFFYQLFNARQLLCLALLLEKIQSIPDRNTREFMLLAFSSCLETNNVLCKYETKWHKTSSMFGIPAYHPVERTAENNVWGTKFGRGTFTRCYLKMVKGKTANTKSSGKQACPSSPSNLENDSWLTETASTWSDLKNTEKNALLVCQNSNSLTFVPNSSVDLVITDPPYFDALNYSRLADFFYVWLRLALMKDYEHFKLETSARAQEVVMNGFTDQTLEDLVESLTKIFSECNRVLKPERPMVFTFHHTQNWAWRGLLKTLNASKFSIVESHFVRSEGRTGFRKGHISYDVCFVCKKKAETQIDNKRKAVAMSKKWITRLVNAGNGLNDSDVHCIVMGNLLTYTPNGLTSDSISDEWIQIVLDKCKKYKDTLEAKIKPVQQVDLCLNNKSYIQT
jgi:putative DNA methylase